MRSRIFGGAPRHAVDFRQARRSIFSRKRHERHTISTYIAATPERVYAFASNPQNLPRWVPSFFESIERIDAAWVAQSPLGRVVVEFVPRNDLGVLDHTVTLPSGRRLTNPLRVIANGEGSEILFTLLQREDMDDAQFRQDAVPAEVQRNHRGSGDVEVECANRACERVSAVADTEEAAMKRLIGAVPAQTVAVVALLALLAYPARAHPVSLPDPALDIPLAKSGGSETAVFAGGCFWGVEGVFERVKGVRRVVSGYSGGAAAAARYERVASGRTGHAEAVRIEYDPARISYGQLLKVFFSVAHDPTQRNRQGPDVGPQYRSAIFYADPGQKRVAERYMAQLQTAGAFSRPLATELAPLRAFYEAEAYHQDFLVRHPNQPYIVIHDLPKLAELKRRLPALYEDK